MQSPAVNLASLASFLPSWLAFHNVQSFLLEHSPFARARRPLSDDELRSLRERAESDTWNLSAAAADDGGVESIARRQAVFYRLVELLDAEGRAGVIGFVEELLVADDFKHGVRGDRRALKVLSYGPFFNREVRALAALRSLPNVVRLHNSFYCRRVPRPPPGLWQRLIDRVVERRDRARSLAGIESRGIGFVVLERAALGDLRQFAKAQRRCVDQVIARRLSLAFQLAHALHSVHARKFVHRDLQPGNILIDTIDSARASSLLAQDATSDDDDAPRLDPYRAQSRDDDDDDEWWRLMVSDFDAAIELSGDEERRSYAPAAHLEVRPPEALFPLLERESRRLFERTSSRCDVWAYGIVLSSLLNYDFLSLLRRRRNEQLEQRRCFARAFHRWYQLRRRSASIECSSLDAFTERGSPRVAEQLWRLVELLGLDELHTMRVDAHRSPLLDDFLPFAAAALSSELGERFAFPRANRLVDDASLRELARPLRRSLIASLRADPRRRATAVELYSLARAFALTGGAAHFERAGDDYCARCRHTRTAYVGRESERRLCSRHCARARERCALCARADAIGRCERCARPAYCSRRCQRLSWHEGGHRDECAAAAELSSR